MTCSNLRRNPAERCFVAPLERSWLMLSPSNRTTVERSTTSKHHKIISSVTRDYGVNNEEEEESIVLVPVAPSGYPATATRYRNDINAANARVVRVVPARTGGSSPPRRPNSSLPLPLSPSRFRFRPIQEDGENDETTEEAKSPSTSSPFSPPLPLVAAAATNCPPNGIRLQPRFSSANVLLFHDSFLQLPVRQNTRPKYESAQNFW